MNTMDNLEFAERVMRMAMGMGFARVNEPGKRTKALTEEELMNALSGAAGYFTFRRSHERMLMNAYRTAERNAYRMAERYNKLIKSAQENGL